MYLIYDTMTKRAMDGGGGSDTNRTEKQQSTAYSQKKSKTH